MSITKYEIMQMVAETNNFTSAAERLNLTQSAVSRAIKNLEFELGSELFIRKKSGVHLTRFGMELLPRVEEILKFNEELFHAADIFLGKMTGKLVIGSFSSVSASVLPDLIARYREKYPSIHIEVKEGHYDEIKRWLHEGSVDVCFLIDEFIDDEEKLYLFSDEVKLLAPKGWIKGKASIRAIEKLPLIATEYYPNPYLSGIFKKYEVIPDLHYIVRTNQTVFAFLNKGLGVALLPESTLPDRYDFEVLDLKEKIPRHIHLVTKRTYLSQPVIKAFWQMSKSLYE